MIVCTFARVGVSIIVDEDAAETKAGAADAKTEEKPDFLDELDQLLGLPRSS